MAPAAVTPMASPNGNKKTSTQNTISALFFLHGRSKTKYLLIDGLSPSLLSKKAAGDDTSNDNATVSTCSLSAYTMESLSSSSSQPRPRQAVHFQSKVSTCYIPSVNDFSSEEIKACWFTREESFDITQRCVKEILQIEKGTRLNGKKYCARGLESSARLALQAKKLNRRVAYGAVLDLQEEQLHEHPDDHDDGEGIRETYYEASMSCQMWAHAVGMQDQREAELIYDDEEDQQ